MSGGGLDKEDDNVENEEDFPLTVMVTGNDGQAMLDILAEYEHDEHAQVFAKISLVRDETSISDSNGLFAIVGNRFWPGVRATSEALQIFSKNGWGVHAVQSQSGVNSNNDNNNSVELEWQLFLLQHDMSLHAAKE